MALSSARRDKAGVVRTYCASTFSGTTEIGVRQPTNIVNFPPRVADAAETMGHPGAIVSQPFENGQASSLLTTSLLAEEHENFVQTNAKHHQAFGNGLMYVTSLPLPFPLSHPRWIETRKASTDGTGRNRLGKTFTNLHHAHTHTHIHESAGSNFSWTMFQFTQQPYNVLQLFPSLAPSVFLAICPAKSALWYCCQGMAETFFMPISGQMKFVLLVEEVPGKKGKHTFYPPSRPFGQCLSRRESAGRIKVIKAW